CEALALHHYRARYDGKVILCDAATVKCLAIADEYLVPIANGCGRAVEGLQGERARSLGQTLRAAMLIRRAGNGKCCGAGLRKATSRHCHKPENQEQTYQ